MNGPNGGPVLAMFDLDGTLISGYMDDAGKKAVFPFQRVRPLPNRVKRITELRAEGTRIAVITNQGGIAFGYNTEREFAKKWGKVQDRFGFHEPGPPVSLHVCFAHPRGDEPYRLDSGRRKPSPAMLLEAMQQHSDPMNCVVFDGSDCLFVGDMESDRQAAFAAGVPYLDAKEFFDA